MRLGRHRLSLLALGILAPVLSFGAIALGGAPMAEAIDEKPFYISIGPDVWGGNYEPAPYPSCYIGILGFDYCRQG